MLDYDKYLKRVFFYLKFRNRSEKEIRDFLSKKNAPVDIVTQLITYCKKQGLINDKQFAADWLHSCSAYRLKSKKTIKKELFNKGISPEIVESIFLEYGNEDGKKFDDETQIKKIISQKWNRYKSLQRQEIYRKLGGLLLRRGFEWDSVKRCIDGMIGLEYNNKQNRQ